MSPIPDTRNPDPASPAIEHAKFDHIGFGVRDLESAMEFFVGRLGGRPFAGGPTPAFVGAQWEFRDGERLEAIKPNGPPGGFLHRFLEQRGPGIHHVTFKVDDIYPACDAARAHGFDVVGFNDSNPGWKEAFLHPKQAQGNVIQLAQADPDLDEDWDPSFRFPPSPAAAAEPVRVVGLRIVAHDQARARALWSGLLGGREAPGRRAARRGGPEAGEDDLVFHWTDSRLRIAVTIDAGRSEGPLHVEVGRATDRAGDPEALTALGATFVSVDA